MFQMSNYIKSEAYTIYDWEKQFWNDRFTHNKYYELYLADIDTTFALLNKNIPYQECIRVAGDFTAKHLPWYPEHNILTVEDKYNIHSRQTDISTISNFTIEYINSMYDIHNYENQLTFVRKTS